MFLVLPDLSFDSRVKNEGQRVELVKNPKDRLPFQVILLSFSPLPTSGIYLYRQHFGAETALLGVSGGTTGVN